MDRASLLWDSIRVLTRLLKRASALFALDFEDHSKSAKKLHHRIFYARTADQRGVESLTPEASKSSTSLRKV